jgi:hypothetical protein
VCGSQLAQDRALRKWEPTETPSAGRKAGSRNPKLAVCDCQPPIKIRTFDIGAVERAEILCLICNQPFKLG